MFWVDFHQHNLLTVDIIPLRQWVLKVVSDISSANVDLVFLYSSSWTCLRHLTVDHGILLNRFEKPFGGHQRHLDGSDLTLLVENKQYCQLVTMTQLGINPWANTLFSVREIEKLVRQTWSSHQHTDDIQIYDYSKQEETTCLVQQTVECFCAIAACASSNRLYLNSSKTDAI